MSAKRKLLRNMKKDALQEKHKLWRKGKLNTKGKTIHEFVKQAFHKRCAM